MIGNANFQVEVISEKKSGNIVLIYLRIPTREKKPYSVVEVPQLKEKGDGEWNPCFP
jgi:hypothetical protein